MIVSRQNSTPGGSTSVSVPIAELDIDELEV